MKHFQNVLNRNCGKDFWLLFIYFVRPTVTLSYTDADDTDMYANVDRFVCVSHFGVEFYVEKNTEIGS